MKEGEYMKFQTHGKVDGPVALLIHAMFFNPLSFTPLVEHLKDDYYIIMPTLDGHDAKEDSTFLSVKDEGDKILNYLNENNISKVDLLLGTSLGAIIAFEVYNRNMVTIDKVFLDGGPFLNFPKFLIKIAEKKFWELCIKARENPMDAIKTFDKLFPGLGELITNVCKNITKESVENLATACYTFKLPNLDPTAQKPITFIYGSKEPARMSVFKLRKYKNSSFINKIGYNHCGFLLSHPKEYAELLIKDSID